MASTSNSRFILSPEQLKAYLIRIHHPKPSSPEDSISNGHDDDHDDNNNGHNNNNNNTVGLGLLTSLQRQHLAFIPFENLSVHYSSTDDHDAVTLDPEKVYTKIVTRQRGGYCMENNLLFGILLRTLGFTVYSVGGRVSHDVMNVPDGGYGGWYVPRPLLPSSSSFSSSPPRPHRDPGYLVKSSSPTYSAFNIIRFYSLNGGGAPLFV